MRFTVLMTATGGAMAPLMIRQFRQSRRHDLRVVGVDGRADAIGRHFADAFEQVPLGSDSGYVDAMLAVVERQGAQLILPTSDEEALALSAARDRFAALGCQLACTSHDNLLLMSDKAATFRLLEGVGIPVPRWKLVHTLDEMNEAVDELLAATGEAVVKPIRSRGGRDVYVLRPSTHVGDDVANGRESHLSPAEFAALGEQVHARLVPAMVMERLVPPGWDIDLMCRNGEPLRVVPRRRVNPTGIPFLGGWVENDAELVAIGAAIGRLLKLDWLYDVDLFTDRQGCHRVLEVNPRSSGSVAATVVAGIPLLDDLVSLAKGEDLPAIEVPVRRLVLPFTDVAVACDDTIAS